ncbi:hypothetical protein L226DRAFT_541062 [Lentinus tigrinus ALCF2SS1-7]|uniref:uncharacterized protein n=1 Tax=Lentinus tigrinus ALCF2SS1-7 TaxID=1328758 RepID=UPI0011660E92|nr:hypothetical protein L226DRAFT_541062 [Lentinus tigrinus ALCF2SS1-7]
MSGGPPAKDGISSTDDAASAASPNASTTSTSAVESESISDSHDANCLGPPPRPAPPAETPADETQVGEWEPAIVPKFYGYYGAVEADGSLYDGRHRHCDEDDECLVSWPTRILLVEECGSPIEPRDLPRNEREKVFELIKRLHKAGFMNGSTYPRNMLSQPGPLSVPRKERSDASASYRIIDFGRSSVLSLLPEGRRRSFEAWCEEEVERAMRYLLL